MKIRTFYCVAMALLLIPVTQTSAAQSLNGEPSFMNWQLKRLFRPSEQQLQAEQNGFIFIYDGIKSNDVEKVMQEQFHRLDSMMFTGIIITNEDGEPVIDPKTGLAMREDDGC
ncbi:MAG: hypothetical protein OEY52_10250 [Gammaproteobacteria bacterium]|nr:hypothetical protein [Gammaproteobacteria bacterium]